MAYNIGDKVTIKESLDPGCQYNDYQGFFSKGMLEKYGGKTFTIIKKRDCKAASRFKYPSDGFLYILEEPCGYIWTIGMFKSSEKKTTIKIKKQSIKLNYSL